MHSDVVARTRFVHNIMELLEAVPLLLMLKEGGAEEQGIFILIAAAMMASTTDDMGQDPIADVPRLKANVLRVLERVETDMLKFNVKV